jgi:YfiH family protein
MMNFLRFESLKTKHGFSLRENYAHCTITSLEEKLHGMGFQSDDYVYCEQVHGNHVAVVDQTFLGKKVSATDALVTQEKGLVLVIQTADCCPIFLYDPEEEAVGLIHSGKKGTQLDILTHTISKMREVFGTEPKNLQMALGPCIRPPFYEIDFAAEIIAQGKRAGVLQIHDCELNTGADLNRFYSYRMEKGKTGRHYSAICLN